jgi:hypothetical protein
MAVNAHRRTPDGEGPIRIPEFRKLPENMERSIVADDQRKVSQRRLLGRREKRMEMLQMACSAQI